MKKYQPEKNDPPKVATIEFIITLLLAAIFVITLTAFLYGVLK